VNQPSFSPVGAARLPGRGLYGKKRIQLCARTVSSWGHVVLLFYLIPALPYQCVLLYWSPSLRKGKGFCLLFTI
jgi:hypothetical protein